MTSFCIGPIRSGHSWEKVKAFLETKRFTYVNLLNLYPYPKYIFFGNVSYVACEKRNRVAYPVRDLLNGSVTPIFKLAIHKSMKD